MVDVRTYPLWRELACRPDLPDQALPAVVDALTLRGMPGARSGEPEKYRTEELGKVLPQLLARITDPAMRAQLVHGASREQVITQVLQGTLTAADLPLIVDAHRVSPELVAAVARHPRQVPAAIELLDTLGRHDIESVVTHWKLSFPGPVRLDKDAPPLPDALHAALLERCLAPLSQALEQPDDPEWDFDWVRWAETPASGWDTHFDGPAWRVLEARPDRWHELAAHPRLGRAVQHLLLDNADTENVSDELLAACLPALPLSELADLARPMYTQLERLSHVAARAGRHPRLLALAGTQLHAVADECVQRGRLLYANTIKTLRKRSDHQVARLAENLAQLSDNSQHLDKAAGFLVQLPQPSVVVSPTRSAALDRWQQEEGNVARYLLSMFKDFRIKAYAALAENPHTAHDTLTGHLTELHPVEVAWLYENDDTPGWLREAAGALVAETADDGVLRVLTDEELDNCPDPQALMQAWLDAPREDELYDRAERAILTSRHRTEQLLRQLPAEQLLTHDVPDAAVPILIRLCHDDPARWTALLQTTGHIDHTSTFGAFLNTLTEPPESQR